MAPSKDDGELVTESECSDRRGAIYVSISGNWKWFIAFAVPLLAGIIIGTMTFAERITTLEQKVSYNKEQMARIEVDVKWLRDHFDPKRNGRNE